MKELFFTIIILFLFITGCKETKKVIPNVLDDVTSKFSIEILDEGALNIISPKADIKVLASGFTWTEGPLWVEAGKYLLFSDIPNNKVYKLDKNNDTITYLRPSGCDIKNDTKEASGSNGLLLNPEGKLVLMQQGDRRVGLMNASLDNPKEDYISLINTFEGKRLNSPNDGVYDNAGNLYFTDPPYGLPKKDNDYLGKELAYQGVYCLLKTGKVLLLDKLTRPNGIALSPDGTVLYVAVSDPKHAVWYAYTITEAGKVVDKRVFYDCTYAVSKKGHKGLPDGMKVNSKGYIFATGPGGVWVFNSSAKAIARIYTGQATSNCALSGDEKRLFLTADDYIMAVDLK